MQIRVIYGILLVIECCGTLGTAVNEAYFALFSMGAHGTGMTPYGHRFSLKFAIKRVVTHVLHLNSQPVLFKPLTYAQILSTVTLTVDKWLANWHLLTIKREPAILDFDVTQHARHE